MNQQPSLLDRTDLPTGQVGSSLPGPQFAPRPGWGGRLRTWLSHNTYTAVFRIVIVIALVLIARSLFVTRPATVPQPSVSASPNAPSSRTITLTATQGDGMTTLAAQAIDLRIAEPAQTIRLNASQHLFAVDTLARIVGWIRLEIGQNVTFATESITSVIERALNLSPSQLTAWARYLRH